jgi:predicted RNA polymerase sigma factor
VHFYNTGENLMTASEVGEHFRNATNGDHHARATLFYDADWGGIHTLTQIFIMLQLTGNKPVITTNKRNITHGEFCGKLLKAAIVRVATHTTQVARVGSPEESLKLLQQAFNAAVEFPQIQGYLFPEYVEPTWNDVFAQFKEWANHS